MASITSTASGNWATPGTWVGGVAPGDGDTAIIANGHTVTIASGTSVTVGNSAAPTTPAIQTAVATGGTGILIVDTTATLTLKGNVIQGNATWQVNAGATINFLHATANLTWQIADANSQANAVLIFNGGIGSSRITVHSTGAAAAGGFGWFTTAWVGSGQIQATGVNFTGIGTATLAFVNIRASALPFTSYYDDCQFTSCGLIDAGNAANTIAGATFRVRRTTFRTPVETNSKVISFALAAGIQSGIVMDRVRWEGQVFFFGAAGATNVSWNDCIGSSFALIPPMECSATPHAATVTGLFLYNKIAAAALPSRIMNGTISNLCSMRTAQTPQNGHAMTIDVKVDTHINTGVWEFGVDDEDGDELQLNSNPAAPTILEVTNIIAPPGPGGNVGAGTFINVTHTGPSTNNRIWSHHNTIFTSAIGATPAGSATTENTTGGYGLYWRVDSNAWYRTASGPCWGVFQVNGVLDDDSFLGANYNNRWNMTGSGYNPTTRTFGQPDTPGVNDVTVDPGFVDATRRFLNWGQSITGSLTTIQQVFDELFKANDDAGFNAAFTIDAYLAYMRAGFRPTNPILAKKGRDGTYIGAVPPTVLPRIGSGATYW